jgi:hypothetical protein
MLKSNIDKSTGFEKRFENSSNTTTIFNYVFNRYNNKRYH